MEICSGNGRVRQGTEVKRAQHGPPNYDGSERRTKPRIYDLFRARVYGVDANGEAFETDAVLDNLSAAGLYVELGQRVDPGATLAIILQLCSVATYEASTPRVVLYGIVLRSEPKPNDGCGVAMTLTHHRFLYAQSLLSPRES